MDETALFCNKRHIRKFLFVNIAVKNYTYLKNEMSRKKLLQMRFI